MLQNYSAASFTPVVPGSVFKAEGAALGFSGAMVSGGGGVGGGWNAMKLLDR
jgi:hypothetical protein